MQSIEIRFHNRLCELIRDERNKEASILAKGTVQDWADYRYRVGLLEGLARAKEIADMLADESSGAHRDASQLVPDFP